MNGDEAFVESDYDKNFGPGDKDEDDGSDSDGTRVASPASSPEFYYRYSSANGDGMDFGRAGREMFFPPEKAVRSSIFG